MLQQPVIAVLKKYAHTFFPVVPFNPATDKLIAMDFSKSNTGLTNAITSNITSFCEYINSMLLRSGSRYGIGGYNELRTVYDQTELFNLSHEPRCLHLGVDIWAPAGTPVYAFMGGMVHSVAFNNRQGDYGATIILSHQLDGITFYTLYGHMSLTDIESIAAGGYVVRGAEMAHFGTPEENGHWPPHLHFQVIADIGVHEGDYPGVCRFSEREHYLYNSPNPDLILQMNRFIEKAM